MKYEIHLWLKGTYNDFNYEKTKRFIVVIFTSSIPEHTI